MLQTLVDRITGADFSIKPKSFSFFDAKTRRYFRDLDAYEAPFLEEKLALENICSGDDYRERFTEFKKFIGLARVYHEPLGMPSKKIDEVWHQFILFTKDYFDFCDQYYGQYFHHTPNIPSRQSIRDDVGTLARLYNKTYGKMPDIWEVCEHKNKCAGEP